MFKLSISGKETEVKCGIRFLKELNNRFKYNVQGMDLGFGIQSIAMSIEMQSPDVLLDLIECGTRHIRNGYKPTTEEIEEFLDGMDDYSTLFEMFDNELRSSMATKKSYTEIMGEVMEPEKSKATKKNSKK